MFVRVKSTPNSTKKYIQIVAGYREGGKVKQRIVRHVGYANDEDELQRLKDLAEYLKSKIEADSHPVLFQPDDLAQMAIEARRKQNNNSDKSPLNVDLKKLREESRIVVGIHEVFGKLYSELGFDKAIGNPSRRVKSAKILKHIVMARIANPCSKRSSTIDLARDFGIHLDLPAVYRMMSHLDDDQYDYIQQCAYTAANDLFSKPIDVVFYDCTTLYFESVEEDELKAKGFSKDKRFEQSQVLLALMVTKEGLPIGYQLYKGNTYEGDTLEDAIKKVEERFSIEKVIFVADSAMLSKENLTLLEGKRKHYIVGARIRNMNKGITDQILDIASYEQTSSDQSTDRIKVIKLDDKRKLILHYSDNRARKDAHDRQTNIDKLNKKLTKSKHPASLFSNSGYKKYLKIEGEATIVKDEEKILDAARWDGLHGVVTNIEDMEPLKIRSHYHGLWQVELGFRITKHDLKVRPIFHWTPQKIRAHIAICFMALVLVRHLSYRIGLQYQPTSERVIVNELNHVQLSLLKHIETGSSYAIPSKISTLASKIYRIMNQKLSDIPFQIK